MTKVPLRVEGDLRHVARRWGVGQGPTKTARPGTKATDQRLRAVRRSGARSAFRPITQLLWRRLTSGLVRRGVPGHPVRARQLSELAGRRRRRGVLHMRANDSPAYRYRVDIRSSYRLSAYRAAARAPRTEVTVQQETRLQEPDSQESPGRSECPRFPLVDHDLEFRGPRYRHFVTIQSAKMTESDRMRAGGERADGMGNHDRPLRRAG